MKKNILLLTIFIAVFGTACRTTKKVQTIQTAISKKDTVQTVIVKETPKIDSVAIVRNLLKDLQAKSIDFKTFYSKIKVDYESANDSKNFTAYLYMKKDSSIILRLVGSFLGITKEGVAAKITKDSVIVVDKINKTVQYRKLTYLTEVTKIPFDFTTIQNILIGNPIFLDSNVVSYRNAEDQINILMVGNLFKHLLSLDKSDYKVLHSKLDDIDDSKSRTCDITYGKYENTTGINFSTLRKISVAEKSKLDVSLDYKQYIFNEPLTYTFSVPKNYKKQ